MKRLLLTVAASASAVAMAPAANAATLLTFGQAGQGSPITATTNGAQTQTTIAASNIAIDITQLFGSSAATLPAFLTLNAVSSSAATSTMGFIGQMYNGSFSITNGTTNYLSGTFTGATFGTGGAATLSGSQPTFNVTFTSNYFLGVNPDRAVSFSFANVAPNLGICGTTICGFTSSVSGTFSGNPVPEPATWAMMMLGFGAMGAMIRRRKTTTSARIRFA